MYRSVSGRVLLMMAISVTQTSDPSGQSSIANSPSVGCGLWVMTDLFPWKGR